jgi:hypothetical protein
MNRRQWIKFAGASALTCICLGYALALGGTAAISSAISGQAKLRMRATSISESARWGIFVQQVVVRSDKILPVALIACFEFGRKQDPFVYPELTSAALPLATPPDEAYKIAVYFFENSDAVLQPHSDAACLANRFESTEDASGRTMSMYAAYWDDAQLPMAVVHEISIGFSYLE